MTDAYRTSAFACPRCSNSALREFHDRLVCDECNGMLISLDDITESIHELDGSKDKLDITDGKAADKRCPRCSLAMAPCTIKLGEMTVYGQFLHCAAHGLWFPRDAMTALFARVSRRGGFRGMGAVAGVGGGLGTGGRGGNDSSVIANMPSGHSGMSGAMASINQAFSSGGPASAGLAISNWQSRRPRVHTLFVSAHKDRKLGCPSCKEAALAYLGDRWACSTCAGSFVENAALAAMVEEMAQKPWAVPAVSGAPGERACPICKAPMLVEVLEAVTIDRCGQHGVWFDDTELQTALHHASAEPHGIGSWLRQLFLRHGSTE
jgi:ribosomal protein S27AE